MIPPISGLELRAAIALAKTTPERIASTAGSIRADEVREWTTSGVPEDARFELEYQLGTSLDQARALPLDEPIVATLERMSGVASDPPAPTPEQRFDNWIAAGGPAKVLDTSLAFDLDQIERKLYALAEREVPGLDQELVAAALFARATAQMTRRRDELLRNH